jgi:hypothetical protein
MEVKAGRRTGRAVESSPRPMTHDGSELLFSVLQSRDAAYSPSPVGRRRVSKIRMDATGGAAVG